MITAATLMQRVPARMRILLVLLLAVATTAIVIAAAFHGVPFHGVPRPDAMSYDGHGG